MIIYPRICVVTVPLPVSSISYLVFHGFLLLDTHLPHKIRTQFCGERVGYTRAYTWNAHLPGLLDLPPQPTSPQWQITCCQTDSELPSPPCTLTSRKHQTSQKCSRRTISAINPRTAELRGRRMLLFWAPKRLWRRREGSTDEAENMLRTADLRALPGNFLLFCVVKRVENPKTDIRVGKYLMFNATHH